MFAIKFDFFLNLWFAGGSYWHNEFDQAKIFKTFYEAENVFNLLITDLPGLAPFIHIVCVYEA